MHLHDPQCTTKKDALRSIHSTVQLKMCEMQDSWKNKILERYAEHFNGVLNRPLTTNPVNESGEVQIAIHQLSSGKAPRSDSIPAKIYKEGGTVLTGKFLTLIQLIWMKEQLPQDIKDASITHIYKRKGN